MENVMLHTEDSTVFNQREQRIIVLMVQGLSYREMAHQLYVSRDTIQSYSKKIFKKLHAHNKVEALAIIRKQ